mmetsp:Transcript_27568/g.56556  ORF Transcript_27568/g.56556 Transcript_27568/m.56556 type:complete len:180 (+) Transcript_27568:73-612(+)
MEKPQTKLAKAHSWTVDGPMSFRMLGVLGGSAMIIFGFCAFLGKFFSFSMLEAVLQVYTFFFGFIIVMLEGQGMFYPAEWKNIVKKQAKFLTLLNGRGVFYVFIGTLLMAQWPDFWESLLGVYMVVLGVAMFVVGFHSKTKLDNMRTLLQDEVSQRQKGRKKERKRKRLMRLFFSSRVS